MTKAPPFDFYEDDEDPRELAELIPWHFTTNTTAVSTPNRSGIGWTTTTGSPATIQANWTGW